MHRALGKGSYVVFSLLILSFIPMMINQQASGNSSFLLFPIADVTLLLFFYTRAIIHKKVTPIHMRYMIGTAIVFLDPTLGRIPEGFWGAGLIAGATLTFSIINLLLIGLIFFDYKHKAPYRPYVNALIGFVVYEIIFYAMFL